MRMSVIAMFVAVLSVAVKYELVECALVRYQAYVSNLTFSNNSFMAVLTFCVVRLPPRLISAQAQRAVSV
jgi:hypothetical protein